VEISKDRQKWENLNWSRESTYWFKGILIETLGSGFLYYSLGSLDLDSLIISAER
jgi:hypothetical protein